MNNEQNEKGDDDAGLENLARARGEQSPDLNNKPEPEISARLAAKAVAELDKQLEATRRVAAGVGEWEDVPDYPTRQKAIELVLAYRLGRPIERQVKLTGGFQSHNDKVAALCATPEGLRMAIAVGLVQEDTRTPGRPTLKSEKKPKELNVSDLRSLNKPEKDENDTRKNDANAKGLF